MNKKQKLKELYEKFKKWSEEAGDEDLDNYCDELKQLTDDFEDGDEDGSNPPGGPTRPPATGRG